MDYQDWVEHQEAEKIHDKVKSASESFNSISWRLQSRHPKLVFKVHDFVEGVSLIVRQPSGENVARITYECEKNQYTITIEGQPPKSVTFNQSAKLLEEALSKLL